MVIKTVVPDKKILRKESILRNYGNTIFVSLLVSKKVKINDLFKLIYDYRKIVCKIFLSGVI